MKFKRRFFRGMLQNWMDENGSNQPDKRMWNCRGTFFAENDSHQKDDWYQRHKSLHDNRPEKRRFLFIRFLSFFLPVLFVFIAIILTILKLFYDNFQEVFPDLRGFMPVVFAFPVVIGILFYTGRVGISPVGFAAGGCYGRSRCCCRWRFERKGG